MSRMKTPGRATIATHPPESPATPTRPIAPPLTTASVYRFGDLDTLLSASRGEKAAQTFYRRYGHPNGRMIEQTVATLEGAEDALACSAGMSAVATIFQTLLKGGDRILAARDLYGGTYHFLGAEKAKRMLIEFDQTTMAKMTAALDTAPRDAQAYRGRNCRVRDPVSAR